MKRISSLVSFLLFMPSISGACEPGSGSYYSDRQFLSAVDFAALGVQFDPELSPQSTQVADITGDGLEDFIVGPELSCSKPAYPIRVLVNDGLGSLIDETDTLFATPVRAMEMVRQYFVADFNDDGFPDLFLSTTGWECERPWPGEQNVLYLSDGLGQLHDATINLPQEIDFSHGSTVGDFSGDGIPDIYVSNLSRPQNTNPYNLLLNDGSGKFTVVNERLEHLCEGEPCGDWWGHFWSQFIDANGDGFLDLFLNTGEVHREGQGENFPLYPAKLVLNDGTGHFGDPVESAIPPRLFGDKSVSHQSLVADLNGDGLDDLIVDENENHVERTVLRIFINNGDGTFADETAQRLPGQATDSGTVQLFHARDYNADGAVDLIGSIDFNPKFLINDGSGVMRELPQDVPCIDLFWNPIDIDGDNGVDFIHNQNIDNNGPWYYLVKSLQPYGPDFSGTLNNDRFVGGLGTNTMDGGQGDDELLGGDGDDLLIGGEGNDTLWGENGDDRLIGGAGIDTAKFRGHRAEYSIIMTSPGSGSVSRHDSSSTDSLEEIEFLVFANDVTVDFSADDLFKFNVGLNDAWFYPPTTGQGFFINVFPDIGYVSLSWFTYETERPDEGVNTNLGDPGHRWLLALGKYSDDHAVMDINITSGGVFDTPTEVSEINAGTITLTFTDCENGHVEYDIPSIGRKGVVPIQRVVDDNIALCETLEQAIVTQQVSTKQVAHKGGISGDTPVTAVEAAPLVEMTAGLNDAWYYSPTTGQGFFINVFPNIEYVSLSWFTYDTELPPEDVNANLGEPGHRWLTALGTYTGNQAIMDISITSGGIFDTPTEFAPVTEVNDGTIMLTFSDCENGMVKYDITSIDRQGVVPIKRVVGDNIAFCESLNTD